MLTPLETQCATILAEALTSTYGLVLRTSNPVRARAALYQTRKKLGDAALDALQVRVSPDDAECEIWLIRRSSAPALDIQNLFAEG
jgi:hypothetical protein